MNGPPPKVLKAPFPYFGGKSRVAAEIWAAFGNVDNYVEPFAGSCAVLLGRPHAPRIETINDKDCMLSNFWRALSKDPDGVAGHADWPVNEADLEARHFWLISQKASVRDALGDPEWFDARIAGWWVWGISCWIGGGWCSGDGPWTHDGNQWTSDAGRGVNRKRPHLGDAGQGVNRKLPIHDYMRNLADRLRNVRVCCGDWSRVCGPSVTFKHGMTGVFMDPPYSNDERASGLYSEDCGNIAKDVTTWALEMGSRPDMRIAVAGYDSEHTALEAAGWKVSAWKAHGGYGAGLNGRGDKNRHRERLWFSPACLDTRQTDMVFA